MPPRRIRLLPTALVALGVALILSAPRSGEGSTDRAHDRGLDADEALRVTVAPLGSLTLERSCPPPGILACGPAIRVVARPPGGPGRLARQVGPLAAAGLRLAGYRDLSVETRAGGHAGRVVSGEELLARWRTRAGVVELATHGLELSAEGPAPPGAAAGSRAAGLRVQVNPTVLGALR